MTWMTWRSDAMLTARLASTTRWTSSSPISWSGCATAQTPVKFWLKRLVPPTFTTTDSIRCPAMRSAATVAARIEAMVFSRLTTTPLRRPSDGLSPTPRMLTGAPGSSDSAMTTATRLVPRSRPTVFFRRDKTVLKRLLERGDVRAGCRDYIGSRRVAGLEFVCWPLAGSSACGSDRFGAGLLGLVDAIDVWLHVLGNRHEMLQPLDDQRPVALVEAADRLRDALLHPGPVVLELLDGTSDAHWNVALVVLDRTVHVDHRLVEHDQSVLAGGRQARGALRGDPGQGLIRLDQRRPQIDVEEPVGALIVGDQWRRRGLHPRSVGGGPEHRVDHEAADDDDRDHQQTGQVDPGARGRWLRCGPCGGRGRGVIRHHRGCGGRRSLRRSPGEPWWRGLHGYRGGRSGGRGAVAHLPLPPRKPNTGDQ